ncbi:hypothetical protein LZZ85_13785 [Terrimonas sp. NA20]|uniref:Uncharacterized protein n=1 Tax=Terrimonas ginsenosidimutans TaxID=2908004 RepID=A0ABS9KSR3_9BACT|nr:hypothetical protein [Terrimonas ginsenosidimutans]MCG2615366.1 hypothetical protein [Terrimonas ginsenosidimutans]
MLINIDFENTYEIAWISNDFSEASFYSPCKGSSAVLIRIRIAPVEYSYFPDVYNLSFGPLNEYGEIDDQSRVLHSNLSRLFSTIILFSIKFLQRNPGYTIGVDGSTDTRAYLYHRIFRSNETSFNELLETFGVDWFVKVLRGGELETYTDGSIWAKPWLEQFDYDRSANDLYHYYMFRLKE